MKKIKKLLPEEREVVLIKLLDSYLGEAVESKKLRDLSNHDQPCSKIEGS